MLLTDAKLETTYTIKSINSEDEELNDFLFTLGCFSGESITVVSKMGNSMVISVRDARYSIDTSLAEAIIVE